MLGNVVPGILPYFTHSARYDKPKANAWQIESGQMAKSATIDVQIIAVKVKPNARLRSLTWSETDGAYLAQLKSPRVEGKASDELIALVAEHFGCRKADVTIKSGATGRIKRVQVPATFTAATASGDKAA